MPDENIMLAGNNGHNISGSTNFYEKLQPYGIWLFAAQILLIFIVACVSMVNLTLGIGQGHMWVALLSSSLGYILPAPKLRFKKNNGQ
jgi:hypothetical protein